MTYAQLFSDGSENSKYNTIYGEASEATGQKGKDKTKHLLVVCNMQARMGLCIYIGMLYCT